MWDANIKVMVDVIYLFFETVLERKIFFTNSMQMRYKNIIITVNVKCQKNIWVWIYYFKVKTKIADNKINHWTKKFHEWNSLKYFHKPTQNSLKFFLQANTIKLSTLDYSEPIQL